MSNIVIFHLGVGLQVSLSLWPWSYKTGLAYVTAYIQQQRRQYCMTVVKVSWSWTAWLRALTSPGHEITRLCFMSDIALLIDWLYCIDLFSCIAASLFNKLTYFTLLYYSVQAAVRASQFHHMVAVYKLPHRLAVNCNLLQGNFTPISVLRFTNTPTQKSVA